MLMGRVSGRAERSVTKVPAPWRRLGDRLEAELDAVCTPENRDIWLAFVQGDIAARDTLLALFRERAPLVSQYYGEGLEQYLLHAIGASVPCPPAAVLFPGDLLRMSRKERRRWAIESMEFRDSISPRGTPGRPRGEIRVDRDLAARAYRLRLDGKKPRQIAYALHLKDPHSEAARKRVGRLIEAGERISRRKIVPASKKSGR